LDNWKVNLIEGVIEMPKIMIVEDDMIIANGLDTIIRSINKDIETTITGYAKEALETAMIETFELFLLDIQLNDYSGYELAKELRGIDKYKLTPIVFITSIPSRESIAFKEIHCYDYIIKPFKEEEVIGTIGTIINHGINKKFENKYINLVGKNYTYRINMEEIIYMESTRGKVKLVTVKEEIKLPNYTLYKLLEELTNEFVQCHRGFVININYIEKIDKAKNTLKLNNIEYLVPIGRKYKDFLGGEVLESI
jgi:two-component system LytT family response regulator